MGRPRGAVQFALQTFEVGQCVVRMLLVRSVRREKAPLDEVRHRAPEGGCEKDTSLVRTSDEMITKQKPNKMNARNPKEKNWQCNIITLNVPPYCLDCAVFGPQMNTQIFHDMPHLFTPKYQRSAMKALIT